MREPLADAALDEARAARSDRAAVHAAEHARFLEGLQIAAHGLGRDVEVRGEVAHGDPPRIADGARDEIQPLCLIHKPELQHDPNQNNTHAQKSALRRMTEGSFLRLDQLMPEYECRPSKNRFTIVKLNSTAAKPTIASHAERTPRHPRVARAWMYPA